MADSRANIDLVFRNGLKDFEVLPPPEVWDNIHHVVKTKFNYLPLLKTAAAVAAIASMSFLAYRWGMEVSSGHLPEMVAVNQESVYPEVNLNPAVIYDKAVKSAMIVPVRQVDGVVESVSLPESGIVANSLSDNAGINISRKLMADHQVLPGLQDPFTIKYAKVSSPELEAVNYNFVQENIEIPVMERWSISAIASPTYYSQFTSSGNDLAQKIMASDQNQVSYTGGVGLSYKINSRFSIQSGLYYSSIGQEVSGISAYSGFQEYAVAKGDRNFEVLTTNGTVNTNNPDIFLSSYSLPERILTTYTIDVFDPVKANLSYVSSTLYQDMSFLELPVIVRYKVVDRKVGLNLIGGMSYNFLVNNSVYALLDEGKYPVGTTEGLNAVSLSSSLGMGMEYKLSKNLSLNLEPTFRYYLNPFNSAKATGFHPYSIGIFSGVAYKF
jgi:opacity protein-like surface antigen